MNLTVRICMLSLYWVQELHHRIFQKTVMNFKISIPTASIFIYVLNIYAVLNRHEQIIVSLICFNST